MKYYDFKKAFDYISERKESIVRASLGMWEDWNWTAETIFENGEFTMNLLETKTLAGIDGSAWATPSLSVIYKDDTEDEVDCYTEEPVSFSRNAISNMKTFAALSGGVPKGD